MLRIVTTLFLFRFFIMSSPIVGMFSAFMFESEHTPIQMAFVFASFMITMNLFEVPSSIIADRFSRKMVVVCAIIVVMASNIVFLFTQAHWAFIFHMVLAGIGVALFSGTVEALLYDELKNIKKEDEYQKCLAIYHTAWSLGLAVSLFLSAWLIEFGYYIIVVFSLFSCFVSLAVFIFGAKETKRIKEIDDPHSFNEIFLEGSRTLIYNKTVLYLALISIIFGAINCVFGDVAIITSMELGWEKSTIARIFGFNTIWEGLITILIVRYFKKTSIETINLILLTVFILAGIGMVFAEKWSIFMVFPLWWADRLKNMVLDPKIQDQIKSSSRATTTSFVSMCFGLKYTVLMLVLGVIATLHSFALGFVIISCIGFIQLVLVSLFKHVFVNSSKTMKLQ